MLMRLAPVLATVLLPIAPLEAAPTAYAPTSKWAVDFAAQGCVASRSFAAPGAPPLTLMLEPRPASDNLLYAYLLVSPSDKSMLARGKLTISGSTEPASSLNGGNVVVHGKRLFRAVIGKADVPALATAKVLVTTKSLEAELPLNGYEGVRRILGECLDDLTASWGFGAENVARMAAPPMLNGSIAALVVDNDYPEEAIRAEEWGDSEVRVTVGIDGRARDCIVVRSSRSYFLDRKTCDVAITRARFAPALDRAGQPMEAPYLFVLRWRIPGV